ncbi:hypothetical protein TNIN_236141 [Trichonephila inaurata madagascariensis]|uniref:Uncharacterized protein n=1 Tax=Trichonephila inaurata madagascariensis TaxID=2747483 RepID=A0A8X6X6M9_9ARAC|nr:hypothetical protein TNIN_236141 [Trichonephila inaurata madagascariensis]
MTAIFHNSQRSIPGKLSSDYLVKISKRHVDKHQMSVGESTDVVEEMSLNPPQHQVPYVSGSEDATLSNYNDFYRHRLAHEEFKINHKFLIT